MFICRVTQFCKFPILCFIFFFNLYIYKMLYLRYLMSFVVDDSMIPTLCHVRK